MTLGGCSNQEKSKRSYDSLITVLKNQESRIDSLVQLTEELESAKSLKEAKILMGKWFWSEAELRLIDVIIISEFKGSGRSKRIN